MSKKAIIYLILSGLASGLVVGCGSEVTKPVPQMTRSQRIDIAGYQKTLEAYVQDGLVRYRKLKDDSRDLDEFIVSLASVGPHATPSLFADRNQETAFWINAYNAGALRVAVGKYKYPTKSIREVLQNFEDKYRLQIDGRSMTLAQIADAARQAGNNDPRIELALTLPAKGSPKLSSEVYQASSLDRQLDQALARALSDASQVKIDHEGKCLKLSAAIYRVKDALINAYCQKDKTTDASIVNALADHGDVTQRRRLNSAIGYRVGEISFDWSLNEKDEPPCSLD
jgi:hypothetical protein